MKEGPLTRIAKQGDVDPGRSRYGKGVVASTSSTPKCTFRLPSVGDLLPFSPDCLDNLDTVVRYDFLRILAYIVLTFHKVRGTGASRVKCLAQRQNLVTGLKC